MPGQLTRHPSHLKTPIITLYIGTDRVEFHAHEDTLCKLRFFQSELQGSPHESGSKTITMCDDTPGTVSALIEYLYTGNYTYTYDAATARTSGDPVANLSEGRFHISVFAIASKYECDGLAAMAASNFEDILPELESVDTLRLWRYAYGAGPDVASWRTQFERCYSGKRLENWLVVWVAELFENHRQEMEETIAEEPELAADLLRLAIVGKE